MEKITVCVTVKYREDLLFDCLISSMNECADRDLLCLSVFDFGTPGLKERLEQTWSGPLVLQQENRDFVKTFAMNAAIEKSETDFIFLCDTEMTLPQDFATLFFKYVGTRKVWFPICFSLEKEKPREEIPGNGYWRHSGYGMAGFMKKNFIETGSLDLRFQTWGAEDNDLYDRSMAKGFEVTRENCLGLFHNWHSTELNEWRRS